MANERVSPPAEVGEAADPERAAPKIDLLKRRTRKRRRKSANPSAQPLKTGNAASSVEAQLQRCKFMHWEVHPIVAGATDGRRVALARRNGAIEIRTGRGFSVAAAYISPLRDASGVGPSAARGATEETVDGSVITALAFHSNLLLVSRIDGSISAHYIAAPTLPLYTFYPSGGAVWCLATSPAGDAVAVGCEDGAARILTPDDSQSTSALFSASSAEQSGSRSARYACTRLDAADARVVSVAWSHDGKYVLAGTANGGVRRLDASTGRAVASAQVFSRAAPDAVGVWAVLQPDEDSVLTGDSRGVVTVWSADMLLARKELRLEGLVGDITALAGAAGVTTESGVARPKAEHVFIGCAGGGVAMLSLAGGEWCASSHAHRTHTNDVGVLLTLRGGRKVLSAAVDGVFALHSPRRFVRGRMAARRQPSLAPVQMPIVCTAPDCSMSMARYDDRIELWRHFVNGRTPPSAPRIELRLRPGKLGGNLLAAAISSAGEFVAVSGSHRLALFRVRRAGEAQFAVERLCSSLPPARWLAFGGGKLLAVALDGREMIVTDETGAIAARLSAERLRSTGMQEHDERPTRDKFFLERVSAREHDSLAVVVDAAGRAHVVDNSQTGEAFSTTLLVEDVVQAALHSDEPLVFCSCRQEFCLIRFDRNASTSVVVAKLAFPVRTRCAMAGVSHVRSLNAWALFSRDFAALLRWKGSKHSSAAATDKSPSDKRLRAREENHERSAVAGEEKQMTLVRVENAYNILGFGEIGTSALALVERPWELVLPSLPPALPRRHFGT